jgi:hypothetical protein
MLTLGPPWRGGVAVRTPAPPRAHQRAHRRHGLPAVVRHASRQQRWGEHEPRAAGAGGRPSAPFTWPAPRGRRAVDPTMPNALPLVLHWIDENPSTSAVQCCMDTIARAALALRPARHLRARSRLHTVAACALSGRARGGTRGNARDANAAALPPPQGGLRAGGERAQLRREVRGCAQGALPSRRTPRSAWRRS